MLVMEDQLDQQLKQMIDNIDTDYLPPANSPEALNVSSIRSVKIHVCSHALQALMYAARTSVSVFSSVY